MRPRNLQHHHQTTLLQNDRHMFQLGKRPRKTGSIQREFGKEAPTNLSNISPSIIILPTIVSCAPLHGSSSQTNHCNTVQKRYWRGCVNISCLSDHPYPLLVPYCATMPCVIYSHHCRLFLVFQWYAYIIRNSYS